MFTFLAGVDIASEGRYPPQRLKSPGQGLSSQRSLIFRDELTTVRVEQSMDFRQVCRRWLAKSTESKNLAAPI